MFSLQIIVAISASEAIDTIERRHKLCVHSWRSHWNMSYVNNVAYMTTNSYAHNYLSFSSTGINISEHSVWMCSRTIVLLFAVQYFVIYGFLNKKCRCQWCPLNSTKHQCGSWGRGQEEMANAVGRTIVHSNFSSRKLLNQSIDKLYHEN